MHGAWNVTRTLVCCLAVVVMSPTARAQDPSAKTLMLRSRVFNNTRSIRVLLPPGYDAAENALRRYPVFYFTDGVAAWDAWSVPSTVRNLWSSRSIPPFSFVGIDNGGSTRESTRPVHDRASEYLPYPDQSWTESPPEARGSRFPEFLFNDVMAMIDSTFRTTRQARCTGLAGASYGAVAALHTAIRYPARFGLLLLESPSLHIGDGRLLTDAAGSIAWPVRVYIGVGTAEGDTPEARARMVKDARALRDVIERAAPRTHVAFSEIEGATHWYDAWRERLPKALISLLAGQDAGQCQTGIVK